MRGQITHYPPNLTVCHCHYYCVAALLTLIGEDSRDVYSTYKDWAVNGDARRIKPDLQRFAD